ncbi:MAG: diaminopimelate epimerase, partial [Bryobacteraceae bacterium]
ARALCNRHAGVGADGWLVVSRAEFAIRLFNSDGSDSEISGNGTRCAAAFLVDAGVAGGPLVRIATGAGVKELRLLERDGRSFRFEMNMGRARVVEPEWGGAPFPATVLDVGNPQCALHVEHFDFDWRALGARIERDAHFPNRTNVSFFRAVDRHTLEVRFFERGAGETMSSGTGSTGAVAAAHRMGLVASPVTVLTPAGPLQVRMDDDLYLAGPAQITANGVFYL